MFKHKVAEKAKKRDLALAQDQPVQDFLQIWQAMKQETKDRIRLKKLELRVDKEWGCLTQAHKDATWLICFPEHKTIRDTFDAHAINIKRRA